MAGTGMIRLLDPTVKPRARELKMAPRPENLAGKRIGVAWNHFPNGDALLDRLYELLNKRFHFSETVTHMKPQASSGMDDDTLKKLTEGCDFIIIAVGD